MKLWPTIARELERHGTCAMVSVIRAEGSVPREEGARMVVTPLGFHGTIGGGTLEWKSLAEAQALLGKARAVKFITQSLGPDLGQCCGGRVTLAVESFGASELGEVRALAAREASGPFSLSGRLPGHSGEESFGEKRRAVLIFGAGHVGRALILALAQLPYDITWADPRPQSFPGTVPQNVTCFADDPLAAVAAAPEGALAFVMSHSHALDLSIVNAALQNHHIARLGVIGSATKRARFERRLRAAGVDENRVSGMICPIGTGGIRSKLPAAIAISVAHQIIALDEALSARATQGMLPVRNTG